MRRASIPSIVIGAGLLLSQPVFAQSHDHGHHEAPAGAAPAPSASPVDDCPPEHAAMGHCTPAKAPAPAEVDDHASHRMTETQAGTETEVGTAAPPTPVAADYADRIWGREAMAGARRTAYAEHGGGIFSRTMIDLAEVRVGRNSESYAVEGDFWIGGDLNRFVFKAEGEGAFRERDTDVALKALYSRAIDPYFNLQAGVRQDVGTGPSRTYAVAGIEGLAPYWFEVDGYVALSTKGEVRLSGSAEYDWRLGQRLILQPRIEFDLAAQDIPDLRVGAGLTKAEFGLRLRYEIAREFAPYIGVTHERDFGRTASLGRAAGERPFSTAFVLGIRSWF